MKVTVSCVGHASQYFPGGESKMTVEFPSPRSIDDVLVEIGFPTELVMFALVNGERAETGRLLSHGDDVVLVSPLAGG